MSHMLMAKLVFIDGNGVECEVPVISVEMNTPMHDITGFADTHKRYMPMTTEISITGHWNPPPGFDLWAEEQQYWLDD